MANISKSRWLCVDVRTLQSVEVGGLHGSTTRAGDDPPLEGLVAARQLRVLGDVGDVLGVHRHRRAGRSLVLRSLAQTLCMSVSLECTHARRMDGWLEATACCNGRHACVSKCCAARTRGKRWWSHSHASNLLRPFASPAGRRVGCVTCGVCRVWVRLDSKPLNTRAQLREPRRSTSLALI